MALIATRRRGFSSTVTPTNGSSVSGGFGPTISGTTSGGMTLVGQYLYTAQDLSIDDLAGVGMTATWQTDATGGYAHIRWPTAGTAGLMWPSSDSTKKQLYVKLDLRRLSSSYNTKQFKIFGWGYSHGGPTSNFTFGPQIVGYGGGFAGATNAGGVAYSDSAGGGDNSVELYYSGTIADNYDNAPTPTVVQTTSAVVQQINGWDTWEFFVKYNDDGLANGIIAVALNGTRIFQLSNVRNCGTGIQKFSGFHLGAYTNSGTNLVEDYRRVDVSYDQPSWVT